MAGEEKSFHIQHMGQRGGSRKSNGFHFVPQVLNYLHKPLAVYCCITIDYNEILQKYHRAYGVFPPKSSIHLTVHIFLGSPRQALMKY